MDRLERLVNLVAALIDAPVPLTRQELRDRVGGYSDDPAAFRRNFERDKDILRQMGLPLITESLDGDRSDDQAGYRIPRDLYELPDPGLTEAELAALRIATVAVRLEGPWGSDATLRALRKLAAAGSSGPGETAAEPSAAEAQVTAPPADAAQIAELAGGAAVAVVFGAIAEQRRIELSYRGELRRIDPWYLSYRRGRWYLSGFDHYRQEERLYRLDRIEGSVVAVEGAHAFTRPAGMRVATAPPPWRLGDHQETTVRVLIDASQAPWAVQATGDDAVVAKHEDGAVEVELAVTNREALHSWVLGFLDHAEVLAPQDVRDEMIGRLAELTA